MHRKASIPNEHETGDPEHGAPQRHVGTSFSAYGRCEPRLLRSTMINAHRLRPLGVVKRLIGGVDGLGWRMFSGFGEETRFMSLELLDFGQR